MKSVLVANESNSERKTWCEALLKVGYTVSECPDLYYFIYKMSQNRMDIAICSASLVTHKSYDLINMIIKFFPKTKLVLVGQTPNAYLLNNLQNVYIKKSFDTQLGKYFPESKNIASLPSDFMSNKHAHAVQLLSEHFLSFQDVSKIFDKYLNKWVPGFVVMSVVTDSYNEDFIETLVKHSENNGFAEIVPVMPGEVCLILDKEPSVNQCITKAQELARCLLSETECNFSIGISRSRQSPHELWVCRKEALRAAKATHMYGKNGVIHIDYIDKDDIAYAYPTHKEQQLINSTLDGDATNALTMLDDIMAVFKAHPRMSQSLINKFALGILVNVNIAAACKVMAFEKIQMDSLAAGRLLSCKTPDDVYAALKNGITELATEMDEFINLKRDATFIKLSQLKEEQTEFSLNELSMKLGTTVNFLNTAVMNNAGENLFDFFGKNINII